jgi:CubicO group peptidase (beta-lactamase class C family)
MRFVAWVLGGLVAVVVLVLIAALVTYPPQYVYRVFAWGESDVFDWQNFPEHRLEAAPAAYAFEEAPDERVAAVFTDLVAVEDWDAFLAENETQAFIVIQDGSVLFEGYYNDTDRDSIVTSFSVAKSFTSALIGIAIDEGAIASVDDPITDYLPELAERDPRFGEITVRHLLLMASGLEYEAFRLPGLNSDDPLTTYHPDQRWLALNNTEITDPPGAYFQYNKYHPQLLGMVLERITGVSVTEYLQTKIWDPVGMAFDGSWSIDSEASDFEKMETGVNARAIDFAKFGQLFLDGGSWDGEQVISKEWVVESTGPFLPANYAYYYPEWFSSLPGRGYYKYMWWGMARDEGGYDFAAGGDKGQFIYVSPDKGLVIVRNGTDYGKLSFVEWFTLFYEFATEF